MFDRLRDNVAYRVANWFLNHVATRAYRDGIDRAMRRGLGLS